MPPRQRRKFLDASMVHVEKALLARAEMLEKPDSSIEHIGGEAASRWLAAQFRELAEELHYQ